ncbi:hypothetical protein ACFCX4_08945 [Kitasatospora sp. NPDC056327]|uniref:hypothetical protein n=1 Tax=Kitasatospora sp. NPDC056327 TaxID=3345785 RepID=UPI0035E36C56
MNTSLFAVKLPDGRGIETNFPNPPLPDLLHPRLAAQLNTLTTAKHHADQARADWSRAGSPKGGKTTDALAKADDAVRVELLNLFDTAFATAGTARQHAVESYRLHAARFERLRQEALEELRHCAAHANLAAVAKDNPAAVGIDKGSRDPLYGHVLALASSIEQLRLRPLDE